MKHIRRRRRGALRHLEARIEEVSRKLNKMRANTKAKKVLQSKLNRMKAEAEILTSRLA